MAYKINSDCIGCGACESSCPVNAINQAEDKYVIDADACISCGACAAQCPVSAIEED